MVLQSIGTYFGFGPQRNVNLNKETENITPEFSNLKQIGEQFGYNTKLPMLNNMSVKDFAAANEKRMIPKGKEIIKIGGKDFLTDEDRPKDFARVRAGIMDKINMLNPFAEATDLDKLGGLYEKDDKGRVAYNLAGGLTQFDPTDLSQLKLDPSEIRGATKAFKQETAGPTSGIEEQLKLLRGGAGDELIDFYSKAGKRAAGDAFKQYALTEPIRQMFANRAGNIATQRFLDAQGVLEQMPSAVQDIMSKKQRQILESQVGAAEMAKATADQQDSATRFAGLGMQRQFGQNVVYTPPLLRG